MTLATRSRLMISPSPAFNGTRTVLVLFSLYFVWRKNVGVSLLKGQEHDDQLLCKFILFPFEINHKGSGTYSMTELNLSRNIVIIICDNWLFIFGWEYHVKFFYYDMLFYSLEKYFCESKICFEELLFNLFYFCVIEVQFFDEELLLILSNLWSQ
jgi:hypothetical protein